MSLLSRALFSLRGACSSTGRIAARSFSEAAAAAGEGGAPRAATEAERQGAKSKLFKILSGSNEPLTSAQIWEAAEPLGLKSKRFTKQMLVQLRKAGYVQAKPLPASKTKKHAKRFGYRLAPQQQHAPQQAAQRQEAAA
ncbi:hypothetical protein C2E21_6963 [Chlorella sorokiniana]|uniref:Uncharacterized protein n=1 Tax=Chlorella sorokiniana TaxID=3076 RepID=A0A2P6TIR8_CHLSO|nr:hypothetical protein C2E21_6963 [Chlorella sorokiniana]|eukprot:PRW39143.1 hypothetical protein C2E21_6963 [Chlorella sorokiniana]